MKKVFRIFTIAAIAFGMSMTVACTDDNEGGGNNGNGNGGNGGNDNLPTTLDEHFENGVPEGWANIDADGDGFVWEIGYGENSGQGPFTSGIDGSNCISSASWDSEEGPLTPDNYLVTPELFIPNDGSRTLTWYDAAQDASYPEDFYAVYVGTLNNGVFTPRGDAIFSTTLTSADFTMRSVSLNEYKGQNIRIAFRHYNCTDWFVMKIDDVKVQ